MLGKMGEIYEDLCRFMQNYAELQKRHFLRNRLLQGGSAMTTGQQKVFCQCLGSKLAPNRKQFSVEKSKCTSDLFSLDV